MQNFIKVTVMSRKRAKVKVATGKYASVEDVVTLIDPSTRRDIIVNVDEVLMAERRTVTFLDSDNGVIEKGKLKTIGDREGDWRAIEQEDLDRLQYEGPVGVVVLKHGLQTNLGLNGMDVEQTLFLVEESYNRLEEKLLG